MTESRIRHIISGIKAEIRREWDRDRIRQLCIMGMHWNKELLHHSYKYIVEPGTEPKQASTKVCVDCGQDLPLKKYHAFMSHGKLYYRRECNKCNYQRELKADKYKRRRTGVNEMWKTFP